MAVTPDDLIRAMRLPTGDDDALADATRLGEVAAVWIDRYAPDAPEAIRDEAVLRFASYLYDTPAAPEGTGVRSPLMHSGAAALLNQWKAQRAL